MMNMVYNVSAFKGPLLNGALLLQYDNFCASPAKLGIADFSDYFAKTHS